MTLVLEIEYLAGVSFAAYGPDSDAPEWPPQPDRVFSALVAAWAARGEDAEEAEALEWLEAQVPPSIDAAPAVPRTAPTVFVPPNDPRTDRQKVARQVLPAFRQRQPRQFPAALPQDPVVQLLWDDVAVGNETLTALQQIACDVAYVGHSSSLTRCRFLMREEAAERNGSLPPRRRVYAGRLAELRRDYQAGRRPRRGDPVGVRERAPRERVSPFSDRWLLLEHVGGRMPDIRACGLVARAIRDAILSGYERNGLADAIPTVVSGHTPDGAPAREPHLAIIPLAFVGYPHADGHVMGFAVIPPAGREIVDDAAFRSALRAVAPLNERRGRRILTVQTREGTARDDAFRLELSPAFEVPANRRSLNLVQYTRASRDFATVTPIVIDGHLKRKGDARDEEIRERISRACRNIGLPDPELIEADKHSAVEGAPSAYPSRKAPAWTGWRLPPSLATRQLTHAFIRFPAEIDGPVLLGAGRHFGLGLCRPVGK